jgi:hypothetical protein
MTMHGPCQVLFVIVLVTKRKIATTERRNRIFRAIMALVMVSS